ncbi:MAG: SpoVR family protein [Beijerinckiaceae bacterium]|nr:SpoVR family protein [Beijerinckiaceae bacterium]
MSGLLFDGADWSFDTIQKIHDRVEEIALGEMKLEVYPNQIEIITAEQMLDGYAASGMPINYSHWSFGKRFVQHEGHYRKGFQDLAYEIVINSSPCISYVMEGNTALMQTLVIAHAAFGHNHFFRNNMLFKEWTDATGILDYLQFAKTYIAHCEETYGERAVESLLDAAHALMTHGVHRSPRRRKVDFRTEQARAAERRAYDEKIYNELWSTLPSGSPKTVLRTADERLADLLELPQENILYFLEKTAPRLAPWQRELLRIVRLLAQYFHPQRQTKVMNEGTATYVHYKIMNRLHECGNITDGAFLEFLGSHTNVVFQPGFDDRRFGSINPYALGFAMMSDLERVCVSPTAEDREWLPQLAGCNDPVNALKDIWANYRDESFISQFLSPRLMRDWRMFQLVDDPKETTLRVEAIHDERGYRRIRRAFAREYDLGHTDPQIEVVSVDLEGDRRLILQHSVREGRLLAGRDAGEVLGYLADLWGYPVLLREVDENGAGMREHTAEPRQRAA